MIGSRPIERRIASDINTKRFSKLIFFEGCTSLLPKHNPLRIANSLLPAKIPYFKFDPCKLAPLPPINSRTDEQDICMYLSNLTGMPNQAMEPLQQADRAWH